MQTDRLSTPPSRGGRESERWLSALFLLSLALLNPWVRGDGVGYYAFARAPLIQHNFDFFPDYTRANDSFREGRLDQNGQPKPTVLTRTGHLDNHFTVGPAILWTPFLLIAHAGVLFARALGSHVPADGFSSPYRVAMAIGTAFYAFLGLLLSFRLARHYVSETWAFLATLAIWWASSLPVYMYFNPSWSHAHSAFAVALFLWYWHATRENRSLAQWCILAMIVALMLNIYYPNALLLMVLVVEALPHYARAFRDSTHRAKLEARQPSPRGRFLGPSRLSRLFFEHVLFATIVLIGLLPTFISRYIMYGGPFETGYGSVTSWAWRSPFFLQVLFSSEHGLFSWTPILLLAAIGLVLFRWREPRVGVSFLAAALSYYVFVAAYPDWAGISSYGNRFFVSLTPLFVLGLGVFLDRFAALFRTQRSALATSSTILACFILWNVAFMFQWGTHLVPARGPISWSTMIHNQFFVVPRELSAHLRNYLFHRRELMREIERGDLEQLKQKNTE